MSLLLPRAQAVGRALCSGHQSVCAVCRAGTGKCAQPVSAGAEAASDPEQGWKAEESTCVWVTEIASFGRSRTLKFEEEENGNLGLILYESCLSNNSNEPPPKNHKPSKQRVFKSCDSHSFKGRAHARTVT